MKTTDIKAVENVMTLRAEYLSAIAPRIGHAIPASSVDIATIMTQVPEALSRSRPDILPVLLASYSQPSINPLVPPGP